MTSPLIAAKDICVVRAGKHVLDHVSFTIHPGEFITVIGPNGAGKTMLLHALMGFYHPDSGSITRRDNLRIGYVPQRLIPDAVLPITAERFLKLGQKTAPEAISDALALVDASPLAKQPLHILSGGELQRVLLARALLHSPELLVLDEPAQNLDIGGQLAFYKLLETIYRERHISILMVSHDLHMVLASTSKVVCLFHHVCCSGEPEMVTQHPEFAALFGADMSRMMAAYTHAHTHTHEEGHTHAH